MPKQNIIQEVALRSVYWHLKGTDCDGSPERALAPTSLLPQHAAH